MTAKQYLKMSDVFPFAVKFDSDGGIGAVVDSQGEYIAQAMENNYCSHMTNKDKNGYRNKIAKYVSHSVASHDELVAEVERLHELVRLARDCQSVQLSHLKSLLSSVSGDCYMGEEWEIEKIKSAINYTIDHKW